MSDRDKFINEYNGPYNPSFAYALYLADLQKQKLKNASR